MRRCGVVCFVLFFFFNDTATTEIYTLSLHDALPISSHQMPSAACCTLSSCSRMREDRKSTRLNSSHANISYAVFCLKKKKNKNSSIPIKNIKTNTNIIKTTHNHP